MSSDYLNRDDYGMSLSRAPDSDIVKFTFKSSEGEVVRVLKSTLCSKSSVFDVQFSETWDTGVIELDDQVNFDQPHTFALFIDCLVDWQPLFELTVYKICCVYFYANKYDTRVLKKRLLGFLSKSKRRETVDDFADSLELVSDFDELVDLMTALDRIELKITSENGGEAFELARKHKMARQMDRVVEKLKLFEYQDSWSSDLLRRIAIANRKELTILQKSCVPVMVKHGYTSRADGAILETKTANGSLCKQRGFKKSFY